MTLLDAKPNYEYRITGIDDKGDKKLLRRLLDMGITPNSKIYVQAKAPFGGTILVILRGALVALRENAAVLITIKN